MQAMASDQRRADPGASSSGSAYTGSAYSGRDPEAPPLERILWGRHLLDLMWAPCQSCSPFEGAQKTVWPLIRGVPISQPPLEPNDKGKRPMLPLSGVGGFALRPVVGRIYVLDIQRSDTYGDRYYCNIAEPMNAVGWCASYRTYAEAASYDRMTEDGEMAHRFSPMPAHRQTLGARPPAPNNEVGFCNSRAPLAPCALPPAPKAVAPLSVFTPEEAKRQLKALERTLPVRSAVIWGAFEGANLFAVVEAPRARRTWFWPDTSRARDYQIYHAVPLKGWEAPCKAQVSGDGAFPPTNPGQRATVQADAVSETANSCWLLELNVADDGTPEVSVKDRRAALVEGQERRGG